MKPLRALILLLLVLASPMVAGVPQLDPADGVVTLSNVLISHDDGSGERLQATLRYDPGSQGLRLLSADPSTDAPPPAPPERHRSVQVDDRLFVYSSTSNRLSILDLASGEWRQAAAPPAARPHGVALAHLDGRLYLIGGYQLLPGGTITPSDTLVYDIGEGLWSTTTALPAGVDGAAATTLDGAIYVLGGVTTTYRSTSANNRLYRFDPTTGAWLERARFTHPRWSARAVAHAGKIHLVGGTTTPNSRVQTIEIYDPASDQWSEGPELPDDFPGTELLAANAVDDQLYLIGQQALRYDPANATLEPTTLPPYAFGSTLATASRRAQLLLFDWGGKHYRALRYRPADGQWIIDADRPFDSRPPDAVYAPADQTLLLPAVELAGADGRPRRYQGTFRLAPTGDTFTLEEVSSRGEPIPEDAPLALLSNGETIFLVNASRIGNTHASLVRYDPPSGGWSTLAPPPCAQYDPRLLAFEGAPLLLGDSARCGDLGDSPSRTAYRYDQAGDAWEEAFTLPAALQEFSAATFDGALYIAGGKTPGGTSLSTVWRRPAGAGAWESAPSLPAPLSNSRLIATSDALYLIGPSASSPPLRLAAGADQWSSIAPPPSTGHYASAILFDDALHLFGGDNLSVTSLYRYHPESDEWSERPPLPEALPYTPRAVAHGGALYLFFKEEFADGPVRLLRLEDGEWSDLSPAGEPLHPGLYIQAHLEGYGWRAWKRVEGIHWAAWAEQGTRVGTIGEWRRLEALRLLLTDQPSCHLRLRTRAIGADWGEWRAPGEVSGSVGLGLPLDKLAIRLEGCQPTLNLRAHSENVGWGEWTDTVGGDAEVGSDGLRLEALEIQLTH